MKAVSWFSWEAVFDLWFGLLCISWPHSRTGPCKGLHCKTSHQGQERGGGPLLKAAPLHTARRHEQRLSHPRAETQSKWLTRNPSD